MDNTIRTSRDDINVHTRSTSPTRDYNRRARSSSPIKNRHSLPPNFFDMKLPLLPYASSDDLRSLSSNSSSGASGSSMSSDQLKKLSKSPFSKRLHINTPTGSGHVIPIPFAISLPPKLSPKNNHARSRSPSPDRKLKPKTKLVFNGVDYEKVDTLSSDEETPNNTLASSISPKLPPPKTTLSPPKSNLSPPSSPTGPPRQRGPPPVSQNKRKSAKRPVKQLQADELSIIEEQSNSDASSRASSIRGRNRGDDEKSLPPPPETVYEEPPKTPVKTPVRTNIRIVTSPERQVEEAKQRELAETKQSAMPRHTTENNLVALKVPQSTSYLQIQKRSFSDESHVSSLSSFSCAGDDLSLTRKSTLYNANVPHRDASNRSQSTIESSESTISNGSNNSWDSLQRSIDLSRKNTHSSYEDMSDNDDQYETTISSEKPLPMPSPPRGAPDTDKDTINDSSVMNESSIINEYYSTMLEDNEESNIKDKISELPAIKEIITSKSIDEVENQNVEREVHINVSNEADVSQVAVPQETDDSQETIEFKSTKEKDNKGLGKSFNFPNNYNNITNDEATKKRIFSNETFKSRYSYFSNIDGQIEIPDLSEASFSEIGSMRRSVAASTIHGTTFDDLQTDDDTELDLEPIGVPSQRGKRNVTEQFKHLYDTSDSDSDNGSTNFSLYSGHKSKSTPNLAARKNADLPPIPVEKDIPKQTQTPMRGGHTRNRSRHQRHKSMGNIDFNLDDLRNEPPKKPVDEEQLNIQVAEPPKMVNYSVDFKDSTNKGNELNKSFTVNDLHRIKTGNSISSGTASSYQSSKSAKRSDSTSISDVESVVIDLTADEKYDVCMIQRNESTLSYRSITEKHKGKEVEVVLVDDDNEVDLESIYSKYGKNWLGRSASMRSDTSTTSSTFSYNSMASEGQIRLKPANHSGSIADQRRMERSGPSHNSIKYSSSRIRIPSKNAASRSPQKDVASGKPRANQSRTPLPTSATNEGEKYFDYTHSSSYYDFNTFINQKNST